MMRGGWEVGLGWVGNEGGIIAAETRVNPVPELQGYRNSTSLQKSPHFPRPP